MSLEWLRTSMEVKQVNTLQRIISGYAAVCNNVDLGNDVIDPGAFTKTLAEKAPADIGVFIGHDTSALPVGIPITLRVDGKGLFSETLIKPGPVGDDLLATAQFMADHGRPLGQSIGYRVGRGGAKLDRVNGKTVRRLTEIDLYEYSFAAGMAVMNPEALTTGVKALSEGVDTAGGFTVDADHEGKAMGCTVEKRGDKFHVVGPDGTSMGSYDTEAAANAAMAMHNNKDSGGSKTVWDTQYQNNLPDSSFLFIEDGGQKDGDGKTVPRSLRHFPYKDADGKVDLPHIRNALSRIPQAGSWLDDGQKQRLQARARTLLESATSGKTIDESSEWKVGSAALDIRGFGYRLLDLSDALADEHKAMRLLGEDTKDGTRIRAEMRQKIAAVVTDIGKALTWAETIDKGEDGLARLALLARELELLEV